MSTPTSNLRGALFALTGFATFALHDVIVKVLGTYYHPFQIVFFSVLLAFPMLTFVLIRQKEPSNLRAARPGWTWLRTFAVVVTGVAAFYAFSVLPLAQTYAIIFATPLLITILSIPILGERVGPRRWGAVLVGLVGVVVVLRPGATDLNLGHFAALVAAFGGAFISIIVRKIGSTERSVVLLLYPLVANIIIMGALLPWVYVPMPLDHFAILAAMAALSLIAMTFLIMAYREGEATVVAPMQYSQILWATFYGYFFFNEFLDWPTVVGAGIIIVSGVYIVAREGARKGDTSAPVTNNRSRFETAISPRVSFFSGRMRVGKSGEARKDTEAS